MRPDPIQLQAAIDWSLSHETSWDRDNSDNWGIHNVDPPPWNRLLGPVHPRGPVSGVIRWRGQTLAEWGEPDRADLTFSVAKTYLALLAGVAQMRGLLPSVDEPVLRTVTGAGFEAGANRDITWRHLLQQTSEWEGSCWGVPDQVDRYRHLPYQPPREASGRKGDARPLQAPGSFWEYNDVRINQLSLALLHRFRRPLPEVFEEAVLRPLGTSGNWRWQGYENSWVDIDGRRMQSVPGGTHWGGGVSISARDQALIGQLMLDEGRVGERVVVPADWIRAMREPCAIAPWYGFLIWLNGVNSVFPGASPASYFCIGAGASVVWVDPLRQLVAAVRWIDGASIDGFCRHLSAAIPAASPGAPAP